jgi:hypothetical protein
MNDPNTAKPQLGRATPRGPLRHHRLMMRASPGMLVLLLSALLPVGCARPQPSTAPPPTTATAAAVKADPLVGALFLGAGDLHTCTAAVLHSSVGNLILTAAHCLASDYPATFVPGFNGQADPSKIWTIDAVYLDPRWLSGRNPAADFAIARVGRHSGGSLESDTGTGLTLAMAPDAGTLVRVVGYPLAVGGPPIGCSAATGNGPEGSPSLHCSGLTDGTSGAPWLKNSRVVGLIGGLHGGGCDGTISYSPPFDGRVVDLLRRAEAGGPADTAPQAFDNDC